MDVGTPTGQALRALAEREVMGEAEEAFLAYLEQGAPLGHEDEIKAFLSSRSAQERKQR